MASSFGRAVGRVFLAPSLYFDGFWHSGPRVFVNIAGLLLIALVWTPFNEGAIMRRCRSVIG